MFQFQGDPQNLQLCLVTVGPGCFSAVLLKANNSLVSTAGALVVITV